MMIVRTKHASHCCRRQYERRHGKTTTAVNLAAGLIVLDKQARVLVIDLDPQANLSITFGIDITKLPVSMSEILLDDNLGFEYAIHKKGRLHIAPSTIRLALTQRHLSLSLLENSTYVTSLIKLKTSMITLLSTHHPS